MLSQIAVFAYRLLDAADPNWLQRKLIDRYLRKDMEELESTQKQKGNCGK